MFIKQGRARVRCRGLRVRDTPLFCQQSGDLMIGKKMYLCQSCIWQVITLKETAMKNIKRTLTILAIIVLAFSFPTVSFAANPKGDGDTLAIKRQICFLKDFTHLQEKDCGLAVTADLPVKGSKTLVDSITVFLNEELYGYFDYEADNHRLPYEKVFSTDIPHLLKHYQKVYRPYYDVKNPNVCEFATHCLELNLVAQTETYVTYEVIYVFFGEGLEEARFWVTFAKSDGHRLKEVVSTDNLTRYLREHPEVNDNGVWSDIRECMAKNDDFSRSIQAGLLNGKLALQFIWAPGIYDDSQYDLTPLKPYLSAEAQALVNGR